MKKKLLFIPFLSGLALTLSSCNFLNDENGESIFKNIIKDFNLWDFLIVFGAFIVLILIAFFFGYKPVKESIRKRKEYVEGNIKEAEKREEESRGLVDEAKQTLEKSKKDAIEIVDNAKEVASKEKEKILLSAKEEAALEKEKARQEIASEIEAQKDAIHKEIVDVALTASEELLSREVKDEDNKRLLDDFISDLEKEDK